MNRPYTVTARVRAMVTSWQTRLAPWLTVLLPLSHLMFFYKRDLLGRDNPRDVRFDLRNKGYYRCSRKNAAQVRLVILIASSRYTSNTSSPWLPIPAFTLASYAARSLTEGLSVWLAVDSPAVGVRVSINPLAPLFAFTIVAVVEFPAVSAQRFLGWTFLNVHDRPRGPRHRHQFLNHNPFDDHPWLSAPDPRWR